jgi:hypothetical protein
VQAFKFVSLGFAKAVNSGQVRVGSFASYAQIEGERRDEAEATIFRNLPQEVMAGDLVSQQLAKLTGGSFRNMGLVFPETGGRIAFQANDMYCFCMSTTMKAAPSTKHAAFLISDVAALAHAITQRHSNIVGSKAVWDMVRYEPREGTVFDSLHPESPFIKAPNFAWESEVRIIWPDFNRGWKKPGLIGEKRIAQSEARAAGRPQPFVTKRTTAIAAQINRIY